MQLCSPSGPPARVKAGALPRRSVSAEDRTTGRASPIKNRQKQPNVVLFVAEDLDWEGLNCSDPAETGLTGLRAAGNRAAGKRLRDALRDQEVGLALHFVQCEPAGRAGQGARLLRRALANS